LAGWMVPSSAVALQWYPSSTNLAGEGFFGLRRATTGTLVDYIECSSTVTGKTPWSGGSNELGLTFKASNCHTNRAAAAGVSGPTGPIILIPTYSRGGGAGGGEVVVKSGTTYTFTVTEWGTTCTLKVNYNAGTWAPGFSLDPSAYWADLDLNSVPISVTVTATGYFPTACGSSGTWYLDTFHQIRPSFGIN